MIELLSNASGFTLFMLGLFAVGMTLLFGAVSDAILKDLGLGTVANGVAAMSGVILGVAVQMAWFPRA